MYQCFLLAVSIATKVMGSKQQFDSSVWGGFYSDLLQITHPPGESIAPWTPRPRTPHTHPTWYNFPVCVCWHFHFLNLFQCCPFVVLSLTGTRNRKWLTRRTYLDKGRFNCPLPGKPPADGIVTRVRPTSLTLSLSLPPFLTFPHLLRSRSLAGDHYHSESLCNPKAWHRVQSTCHASPRKKDGWNGPVRLVH